MVKVKYMLDTKKIIFVLCVVEFLIAERGEGVLHVTRAFEL